MNVPAPIPYNQIPAGGVFTNDGKTWMMVQSPNTAINLATGAGVPIADPAQLYTYFASATLSFG